MIAAEMPEVVDDLPAGARRLIWRTRGIAATVVNGEILLRGASTPGRCPVSCCAARWRGGSERRR